MRAIPFRKDIGSSVRVRLESLWCGSEVQFELEQEPLKFYLIGTIELVRFFDFDFYSLLISRDKIRNLGEGLGECLASFLGFRFRLGMSMWMCPDSGLGPLSSVIPVAVILIVEGSRIGIAVIHLRFSGQA